MVVGVGQPIGRAALADPVGVRDAVPVARRGRNGLLSLDGNGQLDKDLLHH